MEVTPFSCLRSKENISLDKKIVIIFIACLWAESVFAQFPCSTYNILVQKTSKVSSYQVNTCLGEHTYLSLKKKEWLLLKTSQGKNRRIDGPYSDKLLIDKKLTSITLIESLITRLKKVLRLRGGTPSSCGIKDIDILHDQVFCIDPWLKRPTLCRTDTSDAETVIIRDRQHNKQWQYQWQPGEIRRRKAWPIEYLPINDGTVYQIQVGNRQSQNLTFYQTPEPLAGSYLMAWMLDKQCYRQVDVNWPE